MAFLLTVTGWLGETVIKSLIDKVWDKMKDSDSQGGEGGVEKALRHLKISLQNNQDTITKAENMLIKDENLRRNVNELLVQFKDAAYDAEDLLDKFQFQKLQQKIKQQGNEASHPMKKRKVGDDHDDVIEIKKIQEELNNISIAMGKLLSSDNRGKMPMINEINRMTSSIPVETKVFGRDDELNELMRLLLEQDQGGCGSGSSSNICVLTITGMGGVGKTTLAQEAYNDKKVKEYFNLRIWVCVSNDFTVERLSKEIIESATQQIMQSNESATQQIMQSNESATKQKCDYLNFDTLQVVLKEKITSKKFLLVLDDVWNEDRRKWDSLCAPLMSGVTDSKILVTARNVKIANLIGSVNTIHLKGLDGDNAWAFFKKCAFGSQDSRDHPRLEAIAKEMVPKLKGLPLAARTLGGLLSMNMNEQHWKTIMDSEIWKLPQDENGVLLVLQLSYQYLPAHLKRCFAFCSLYPKDYGFDEHELVRIWMAEGFFPAQKSITMEDFGSGCFQELVSRSFFQKLQYPDTYVMHDLIHDLAQLISEGETYRREDGKPFEIPAMLRHLNIMTTKDDEVLRRMMEVHDFSKLRTLMYPWQYSPMNYVLTCRFPNRLQSIRTLILKECRLTEFPKSISAFIHLRYLDITGNREITELPNSLFKHYNLQALILGYCNLHELPESIGDLIYLRYLDISWNVNLNKLPESLCRLSNLQTLDLKGCFRLRGLAQGTSSLINLRKLDAEDDLVSEITEVGKLTSLQSLSIFKVRKEYGQKLAELSGLTQLHGRLRITSLENVLSKEEAIAAKLQSKLHLDELVLQWTRDQENDGFSDSEEEVLEHLQPNSTLKRLIICGYSGARSPSWLEAEKLPELKTLILEDCKRWDDLPLIRNLSHLKSLLLKRMPAVKQIRQELFSYTESNSFHKLEKFVLEDMTLCEELPILGQLPYLKFLCIPRMSQLEIDYVLRGGLGKNWFPSLEVLELQDTMGKELPLLVQLPSLKVLRIGGMTAVKEITHGFFGFTNHLKIFPTLEELKISNMPVCEAWSCSEDIEWFPCLRVLEIDNCPLIRRLPLLPPSLTKLTLNQVGLTEFPVMQEGTGGSSSNIATVSPLEVQIIRCPNLTSLDGIECFPCLKCLYIKDCPLLTRLPALPPSLQNLRLMQVGLIELPGIGGSSSDITTLSLSWLEIIECSNMTSLEQGLLSYNLPALQCVTVEDCRELRWMPVKKFKEFTYLKSLSIVNCPKLMSMAQDDDIHLILPPSICKLELSNCEKVSRSLPDCLYNLTTLKMLELCECPHFESLPREPLLHLERLKTLSLLNCNELRSIEGVGVLKSLETLKIHRCPRLQPNEKDGQGENIFSLINLNVDNTTLLKVSPLRNALPSIIRLTIESSPEENMFEGEDQELLKSLTSLKYLEFLNCKNLQSLPIELHALPSLELLEINESTKIQQLPEKGLPISLTDLHFNNCHSMLEKQLEEHLVKMKNSGRFRKLN